MADPLHQFKIEKIYELPSFTVGGVTIDMSLTNAALSMIIAGALVLAFYAATALAPKVVPGRGQAAAESLFDLVDNLVESIIGHGGRTFFPFVFSLFLFVLGMNLIGMFTLFTATSQLAVTATLAVMTILTVIIYGFIRHGLGFFMLFVPSGVPWWLLPIIIVIEFASFLMRPATLTLRLFGNMVGGHVVMKIFAGFIIALGSLGILGWLGSALSLSTVVALTALEFLVAYLQAFVFAVLACVYLNDVVNLGHH